MAYIVSQDFTNQLYSGSSKFKGKLTINNEIISNSLISSISISSPIIDTSNEFFYVGSFISQQLTIKFKKLDGIELHSGDEVSLSISQKVNNEWIEVPIGVYLIDDLAENYHKTCEIKCLDYAIKFKPNIDYSPCFVNNKANIRTILNYICNYFNVELAECPTTNDNVEVGTFDSTVSGKQWISYIAEIKGCNAKMDRNGRLVLKEINQAVATSINAKKGKSFELGEKYKISQVTYFDAIRNYTYGEDTDNTLFIRQDNPFVINTEVVENIYEVVNDFEIYKLKAQNYGDFTLDAWDIIEYQVGENSYKTINNNTMTYAMTIMGEVNVNIPSKQQEITTNVVEGNLRTVRAEVNNVEQSITLVVNEIGDRSSSQTTISQDIDDIYARLESVEEVSTEAKGDGIITIQGLMEASVLSLKVHPNGEYDLKNRYSAAHSLIGHYRINMPVIVFYNGDKTYQYELPRLYYYNNTYDEFILDNVLKKAFIIHRIGFNQQDQKYILPEEVEEELDINTMDWVIGEDTNTIFIPGYDGSQNRFAHIEIKAMLKNDLTSSFATTVYVDRSINVAEEGIMLDVSNTYATITELGETERQLNANITEAVDDSEASINLSVSRKLRDVADDDGNVTAGSMVLAINDDGSSGKFKFDKIELEGYTTINDGFSIDEDGNMSCQNANINGDLVSSKGLYTNLQYQGKYYGWYAEGYDTNNSTWFLGYNFEDNYQSGTHSIIPSVLIANVFIPTDFIVDKAYITIKHNPVIWTAQNSQQYTGYARNIKAYIFSGLDTTVNASYSSEYSSSTSLYATLISGNPMGANGKTFSSSQTETYTSGNIANVFNGTGYYNIGIKTSDATPSAGAFETDETYKIGPLTGYASMVINIYGWLKLR